MGLVVCHIPNDEKLGNFILFDSKDFNPDDYNLEKIEEITVEDVKSKYNALPIIDLNDYVIRSFRPKERTVTHILAENHVETFSDLEYQRDLISRKKSNLSHSQRELVLYRYNQICSITSETKESSEN